METIFDSLQTFKGKQILQLSLPSLWGKLTLEEARTKQVRYARPDGIVIGMAFDDRDVGGSYLVAAYRSGKIIAMYWETRFGSVAVAEFLSKMPADEIGVEE